MPDTKQAIIEQLQRLKPFELGDDPYNHGRNDAINQAIQIVIAELTEDEQ